MILLRGPWGFDLSDVRVPVKLWHGELDRNVPIAHAHRLAGALRHSKLTVVPIFDHWQTVLSALIAHH